MLPTVTITRRYSACVSGVGSESENVPGDNSDDSEAEMKHAYDSASPGHAPHFVISD